MFASVRAEGLAVLIAGLRVCGLGRLVFPGGGVIAVGVFTVGEIPTTELLIDAPVGPASQGSLRLHGLRLAVRLWGMGLRGKVLGWRIPRRRHC